MLNAERAMQNAKMLKAEFKMRITESREITREMHIFLHDLMLYNNSHFKFSFKNLAFCIPLLTFDI